MIRLFCFITLFCDIGATENAQRILIDMAHALEACNKFMGVALHCHPPKGKISKDG